MYRLFSKNGNLFYAKNEYAERNTFLAQAPVRDKTPEFEAHKNELPLPIWEGHEDTVNCYLHVAKKAFENFKTPALESGLISPFIDTAFNGNLFMWDSAFNVMYGRYFCRVADFQTTLDNFYANQHYDGFICREISETEDGERFSRDDPGSTGPNILALAEWQYYCSTGNKKRLERVFDPLCGFYKWFMENRSWQDGSYFSCGLACGMDNQPRQEKGYDPMVSHGFMSWIDTCAQQYLSADILVKMAHELGRDAEAKWLREEMERLYSIVNGKMWSERDGFYYDTRRDGSHSGVKTVGAYWTLLAGLVPNDRVDAFVSHLENEAEFKRTHRVPALSADDPHYDPNGGYFCGGVWPQTNYMVLMGLDRVGYSDLAYEIAVNHVENVTKVFNATSQVYENYAPEAPLPGDPAKAGYVGWAGLGPISVLFEYVFGIRTDAPRAYVEWNVRRTERHGVLRLPVGNVSVDLICEARENENTEPTVKVLSNAPVTVKIKWKSGEKTVYGGRS